MDESFIVFIILAIVICLVMFMGSAILYVWGEFVVLRTRLNAFLDVAMPDGDTSNDEAILEHLASRVERDNKGPLK